MHCGLNPVRSPSANANNSSLRSPTGTAPESCPPTPTPPSAGSPRARCPGWPQRPGIRPGSSPPRRPAPAGAGADRRFRPGALAFILTGGQLPATAPGELMDQLRDRGLDLAAELPQVRSPLRKLVLEATNPSPPTGRPTSPPSWKTWRTPAPQCWRSPPTPTPWKPAQAPNWTAGGSSTSVASVRVPPPSESSSRIVRSARPSESLKVSKDNEAAERLRAEATVLARLENDERIVTLHDVVDVEAAPRCCSSTPGAPRWPRNSTTAAGCPSTSCNAGHRPAHRADRSGTQRHHPPRHQAVESGGLPIQPACRLASGDVRLLDGRRRRQDLGGRTPPTWTRSWAPASGASTTPPPNATAPRWCSSRWPPGRRRSTGPIPAPTRPPSTPTPPWNRDCSRSTIAAAMIEFFTAALSRDATRRPDTAEDMLRAWQRAFTATAPRPHRKPATKPPPTPPPQRPWPRPGSPRARCRRWPVPRWPPSAN